MDIMPLVIVAMSFWVQFAMYAQSTGQVTLSIKLYPIQIIELEPTETQTVEILNKNVNNSINQSPSSPPSQQLSTYSTSHYALKVDSVQSDVFQKISSSSALPPTPQKNRSNNQFTHTGRYDYETERNELFVVYSMEAL